MADDAHPVAAHELAITQRHNMELQFVGGNWVRIAPSPCIDRRALTMLAVAMPPTMAVMVRVTITSSRLNPECERMNRCHMPSGRAIAAPESDELCQ